MQTIVLFLFSLFAGVSASALNNSFAKKEMITQGDCYRFSMWRTLYSMAMLLILALLNGSLCVPSLFTVISGALYGMFTVLSTIISLNALAVGSYATTTLLCSIQMMIPALSGYFFWDEEIYFGQLIGLVLLFIGLFLCIWQGQQQKFTWKWLLYCLMNIVFSGAIGVTQKIHQSSTHKDELSMFLLVSFAVSVVFLAAVLALIRPGSKRAVSAPLSKTVMLIALLTGLGTALNHFINTDLAGRISSMIFFPAYNGSSLLMSLLFSILLFHEKFKTRQIIGFLCGLIGVLLIGNLLNLFL